MQVIVLCEKIYMLSTDYIKNSTNSHRSVQMLSQEIPSQYLRMERGDKLKFRFLESQCEINIFSKSWPPKISRFGLVLE